MVVNDACCPRGCAARESGGDAEVLLLEPGDDGVWAPRATDAAASRRHVSVQSSSSSISVRVARPAGGCPGRRDAAAAVHHRAACRPRALPDRLRRRGSARRRRRRPACTSARAARGARRRARHAPRRVRHLPPGDGRGTRGSRAAQRALPRRRRAWARIRSAERVTAIGTTTVQCSSRWRAARRSRGARLFVTPGSTSGEPMRS